MIFIDQLNREVFLPRVPQRIVSLVPSQTELLYDLGMKEKVVGITRFCIHPRSWFQQKTRVGGTKDFKIQRIHALQPDLILSNKEENTKEGIEEIAQHYPVWISDVNDLDSALDMIHSFGNILGVQEKASYIHRRIQQSFLDLSLDVMPKKCIYIIWKNPWMSIGGDTFIHNMLGYAGFQNVFQAQQRYPIIEIQDIINSEAEYILLSSEPYPFKEKDMAALRELTSKKICLVDGEMFSWYGSRLLQSSDYFRKLRSELE